MKELVFQSGNTVEAVRIDPAGQVGIGITNPDGPLHVESGTAGAVAAQAVADELTLESSGETGMSILSPDANSSNIYFGSPADASGAIVQYVASSNIMKVGTLSVGKSLVLVSDLDQERMRILQRISLILQSLLA